MTEQPKLNDLGQGKSSSLRLLIREMLRHDEDAQFGRAICYEIMDENCADGELEMDIYVKRAEIGHVSSVRPKGQHARFRLSSRRARSEGEASGRVRP